MGAGAVMNDQTFGAEEEEWSFDYVVASEEFLMGVFVWRFRELGVCRCAVDALKRKERCKGLRRVRFAEDVIINEREREENGMAMEQEPREAVEWWQFVTSMKMLHSKQFLKRIVGSAEYLDMQAGVRLEGESEGMESGLTRWRTSAHRFFSKLRQRLGERRSLSHAEEEDDGDYVEYIEAPKGDDGECVEYIEPSEFHVVAVEYDYGEVNAEGAGEENAWADVVDYRSCEVALRVACGRVLRKWCDGWGVCLACSLKWKKTSYGNCPEHLFSSKHGIV